MAAQFTATKGRSRRAPEKWMERASSSLPTPVSPWMSTVVSRSIKGCTSSKTSRIRGLRATMFLNVKRSWFRRRVSRRAVRSS
jgi:hypothetical protein